MTRENSPHSAHSFRIKAFPNYGIDGPAFAKAFFIIALLLAAVALAVGRYTDTGSLFLLLTAMLGLAAAVLLLLGISMLTYSLLGKQRLRDHLLRQRAWTGDETVLDIGAGRGLMAIGAAQRAPAGRVVALDIWNSADLTGTSPDALQQNCDIENVSNVEAVTGNSRQLNFPDGSLDVVTSVFCLHNIEPEADRLRACAEIARVLKPGGMTMIADFPGTRGYVQALRNAGLNVDGPYRSEKIGLGISGYLIARK